MPRDVKINRRNQKLEEKKEFKPHLDVSDVVLTITAIFIMCYTSRFVFDTDWFSSVIGNVSLVFALLGFVGFVGLLLILVIYFNFKSKDLFTRSLSIEDDKMISNDWASTLTLAGILFLIALFVEVGTNLAWTITDPELALYYIFGAVIEEVFFRGFLICFFVCVLKLNRVVSAIFSGTLFFLAHIFIYQNNIAMLVSILLGGIYWGLCYAWTGNLSACIISHLIKNLIATMNILVIFA